MEIPTLDFTSILNDDRFNVQVIHGRQADMRKAVERRLGNEQFWHWAIVRGEKNNPQGMMLIQGVTGHFKVLYIEKANCGNNKSSTRHTSAILHLLGLGESEQEVFAQLQKYDEFLVKNIHPTSKQPPTLERLV